MDNKLALTTAITLVHRESQLDEADSISVDLIKELLELVKVSEVNVGSGTDIDSTVAVKSTAMDMLRMGQECPYTQEDLLARLKLNTGDDERWFRAMEKGITATLGELMRLKSISALRAKIAGMINKEKIGQILRAASGEWNFKHDGIENPQTFIQDILSQLEPLSTTGGAKDNAITEEIDFDNEESIDAVVNKVAEINNGDRIWVTGHQGINDMTQGGFREGETWVFGALPHNDKTGTTLTLFRQFAQYNEPFYRKEGKKPTLVRLSFEDPLTNNIQYLYKDIMVNESEEEIDIKKVDPAVMKQVVRDRLKSRGFGIRMAYIDPSDWSFRSLFNYVIELENQGHDVQVLMVDYLSMIPTTGCRQGPMGSDLQDLLRRVRNFCRSRGILFMTPHQLSTEARNLTRGIVNDEGFLAHIAGKGYWQDCKGYDREFDGGIYIHLVPKGEEFFKSFQRDKHRLPSILAEAKKSFYMKYPTNMPIPDDVGKESRVLKKLTKAASNAPSEFFEF